MLGLKRRIDGIEIVRVQDVGLRTLDDPTILQWAADEGRVLITRDIKTIPTFAHDRVVAGLAMPGVLVLPPTVSMARPPGSKNTHPTKHHAIGKHTKTDTAP